MAEGSSDDGRTGRIVRGDFQTPPALAAEVVHHLGRLGVQAASVIEPTCGRGAFLSAARALFPSAQRIGYELDPAYAAAARETGAQVELLDIFSAPWEALARTWTPPVLLLGNPPWVTTSTLGRLANGSAPPRENPGLSGLSALTGAAGFDVSEWLLRRLHAAAPDATLAFLCKVSVARRLLLDGLPLRGMWRIDAQRHFRASVDAGLLILDPTSRPGRLPLHPSLDGPPAQVWIVEDGRIIEDEAAWERSRHLAGEGPLWRSGIKHDAAQILELRPVPGGWENGLGERVDIEDEVLWPFAKGGDLHHGRPPSRHLLLTQSSLNQDPSQLRHHAPRAWAYLQRHRTRLDGRRSRIWRRGPSFGLFGIGSYSFMPFKVAVAGLYPHARFRLLAPIQGRPVLIDDTSYSLSFEREAEARAVCERLNAPDVADFFRARLASRSKRPITAALLRSLAIPDPAPRDPLPTGIA